jgi:hypothetical protein
MTWRRAFLPWSGSIAGALGWSLSHQIGSNSVFDDCTANGGGLVLLVGAAALLLTIVGGVVSLAVWRGGAANQARSFVGLLSALLALLAGFAIVLQSAAGLILPACAA